MRPAVSRKTFMRERAQRRRDELRRQLLPSCCKNMPAEATDYRILLPGARHGHLIVPDDIRLDEVDDLFAAIREVLTARQRKESTCTI